MKTENKNETKAEDKNKIEIKKISIKNDGKVNRDVKNNTNKNCNVQKSFAKMATQKELDEGLKIRSAFIVDVKWLDACQHINVEKINENDLEELLCITHTIGKVVAQDEKVICIATNISEANGLDLIAIPIKWIEEIKIFGKL